jgi:tRNA(adenine34) deaminase
MINLNIHEYWMNEALNDAKIAFEHDEVPVGAIIVYNNQIVARGYNTREQTSDATAHAEMIAIRAANQKFNAWRLSDCDLYVTLEPCPMCAGAILQARIRNVYFGASDPKAGCTGSLMNLLQDKRFNHQSNVFPGILENECSQILRDFFRKLRS